MLSVAEVLNCKHKRELRSRESTLKDKNPWIYWYGFKNLWMMTWICMTPALTISQMGAFVGCNAYLVAYSHTCGFSRQQPECPISHWSQLLVMCHSRSTHRDVKSSPIQTTNSSAQLRAFRFSLPSNYRVDWMQQNLLLSKSVQCARTAAAGRAQGCSMKLSFTSHLLTHSQVSPLLKLQVSLC